MYFFNKEAYKEYLVENEIENYEELLSNEKRYFEWTEKGEIILEKTKGRKSKIDVTQYSSCIGWIILNDGETMALIKNIFGDVYRDLNEKDYNISLYNNILLPEIAIQLKNESAQYYIAKRNPKDVRRYILTLDFRNQKKLIHGTEILEETGNDINELRYENLKYAIEDYLLENGYNMEDIDTIQMDFLKQSIFGIITKQIDQHNRNWGLLLDEEKKRASIAPLYDIDCSCGINKANKKQRKYKNGYSDIYSFLKEFKEEEWLPEYIEQIIQNFDIRKAFCESEKSTNTEIPNDIKEYYKTFFDQRMKELKEAKEKVFEGGNKEINIER